MPKFCPRTNDATTTSSDILVHHLHHLKLKLNHHKTTTTSVASLNEQQQSTRIRALSLYRQLLRGAERMPTPNRQNYIKRKTRDEYRTHMTLTDHDEIDFQLRLADTNLDTVLVQAEHLSR